MTCLWSTVRIYNLSKFYTAIQTHPSLAVKKFGPLPIEIFTGTLIPL